MAIMRASVSVVVPTFNSARTIKRALQSVYQQTLLPSEIIVVDDCSTDDTVSQVEEFTHSSPISTRIVRLDKNSGPSNARNTGWGIAREKYVAFLDSDDTWHHEKIRIQFGWLETHPEIKVSGHLIGSQKVDPSQQNLRVTSFSLNDFLVRNRVSTPTVMLQRELDFRFSKEMRHSEDYDLWLRIVGSGHLFSRLEMCLASTHKHSFATSGLSSQLRPMRDGELASVRNLRFNNMISRFTYALVRCWISLKYVRRQLYVTFSRSK